MIAESGVLSAGEIASRTGVSKDTLRHYERIGLIDAPPRSPGGYRQYSDAHVARVSLIRRALAVGFGLDELVGIFAIRDGGGTPCRQVRDSLALKRVELDRKLEELTRFRDEITTILERWDDAILEAGPGVRAGLLDTLPHVGSSRRK